MTEESVMDRKDKAKAWIRISRTGGTTVCLHTDNDWCRPCCHFGGKHWPQWWILLLASFWLSSNTAMKWNCSALKFTVKTRFLACWWISHDRSSQSFVWKKSEVHFSEPFRSCNNLQKVIVSILKQEFKCQESLFKCQQRIAIISFFISYLSSRFVFTSTTKKKS